MFQSHFCKKVRRYVVEAKPKGKGSLGVEYANFAALNQALSEVFGEKSSLTDSSADLTQTDLMRFGLIMAADSRKRREFLCEQLRIGYANGKQIKKRLNMFKITIEQIEKVMKNY